MNPDTSANIEADIKYTTSNDGTYAIVSKCLNKTATTATIAPTYKDVPVAMIGHSSFSGCTSLTSITIPSSVIIIGENAFSGCVSLVSVTIPESVTIIGAFAFLNCISLTSVAFLTSDASIAKISDTKIHIDAFEGCASLTSVAIPDSVTNICVCAFANCIALKKIEKVKIVN